MSQPNCFRGKKYRLNSHGGDKCQSNERNWSSKFRFEFILIFSIG